MSLAELCDLAVACDYQAICMRPSQLSIHSSPEQIATAVDTIRQRELKVTMVSGDVDIVYNNQDGPNCLRKISPYLDLAESLGAPLVRVCIKTRDDLLAAQRAADEAAERGIVLVHQCHVQSLFETVDQIVECLNEINRSNFGLVYEAANLQQCSQDYGPETIKRLAPSIRNVYLQNQRIAANGLFTLDTWTGGQVKFDVVEVSQSGDLDFGAIFSALKQIGLQRPDNGTSIGTRR